MKKTERKKAWVVVGLFLALFLLLPGGFNAFGFEDITANIGRGSVITYIKGVRGRDIVYIGTQDGLYYTIDRGKKWEKAALTAGNIHVTGIAFSGEKVFVATREGLFLSTIYGNAGRPADVWQHIPGKKGLKGVESVSQADKVVVWTMDDMLIVDGKDLRPIFTVPRSGKIESVVSDSGVIYAACGEDLMYSGDVGLQWDKYFMVSDGDSIASEEFPEDGDEDLPPLRYVGQGYPSGVVVSTNRGIVLFDALTGKAKNINTDGLSSSGINMAIGTRAGTIAALRNKVFLRDPVSRAWDPIFEASAEGDITGLDIHVNGKGDYDILITTQRKVHKLGLNTLMYGAEFKNSSSALRLTDSGPDVITIQRMAIEYAEVSPDKIKSWRRGASWSAVLPRLTFAYGENYKDNLEIYKSATRTYIVDGPRDRRNDWKATMVWDLGDIIWNPSQTSIDVRSRLMVQMRNNILEDVTRLYFERKRLVKEASSSGEGDRAGLETRLSRIEELTAYIDAYTGGGFSEMLEN